jgi:phage portal protein BeeE
MQVGFYRNGATAQRKRHAPGYNVATWWKPSENVAHPLRRSVVAVETLRKRCASVAPSRRCGGNLQKTLRIRCAVASLRWKLSENVAHPLRRRVVAVETLKHAGLP